MACSGCPVGDMTLIYRIVENRPRPDSNGCCYSTELTWINRRALQRSTIARQVASAFQSLEEL